jgi:glycosyltransferase involved in cell wall biosynthesis
MRILVLGFYYSPDLSAGSFRTVNVVKAISALGEPATDIEVLTTMPQRYGSFRVAAAEHESLSGVQIHRFHLPAHRGGFVSQSRSFAAYATAVRRHVRQKDYDVVFATSSRLMTAVLGSWVARRKRIPLYLDIRDIFVDTIGDVLPRPLAAVMQPLFRPLERYAIGQAQRVNLVSRGFADYFQRRYPAQRYSFFTNGIDPEFVNAAPPAAGPEVQNRPVNVLYAGNMGDGQGLHAIIPSLASRMRDRATFTLIGDGGRRADLERALAEQGCSNVRVVAPMPRAELLSAYRDADVLFLHLNNYDAFAKVLPSKIFEYAALGKPVWAGVRGYAAMFLQQEVTNCAVFKPCDAEAAEVAFSAIRLQTIPRPDFVTRFSRSRICADMAKDIVGVALSR